MPGYKVHLTGGAVAFTVVLVATGGYTSSFVTWAEWLVFALAGSLFPDIDTKSKGQKLFYNIIFVLLLFFLVLRNYGALVILALAACIPLLVNHRGIFHRAWFVVAVPFAAAFMLGLYVPDHMRIALFDALFFSAGALSHLWLDLGLRRMFRW